MRSMHLELTDRTAGVPASRSRRSRAERVAPRAAAIDESDEFPRDLVARGGGAGAAGRDDRRPSGAAPAATTSATRSRSRRWRSASAVVAVIVAVNNSLVAEPIAQFGTRRAEADAGCGGWRRGEAIGAFALSEEHAGSDAANQQTVARLDDRGYVLNGRKVWVANAEAADVVHRVRGDAAGHARPRHQRVPGADGHARHRRASRAATRSACAASAAWTSSCATCASTPTRCSARRATASASRCGRSTAAASRSPRRRSASAQAALDEALRARQAPRGVRPADRQLPGDPVDARRHGDRARRRAAADAEGRRRARPRQPRRRRSRRRWPSCSPRRPRTAPPTRRCRSSRRTATAAARWSSGCSATSARRRSTRARRKCSGW